MLVYLGVKDNEVILGDNYVSVDFQGYDLLSDVRERISDELVRAGQEFGLVYLDRILPEGIVNNTGGTFVLSWDD